MSTKSLRERAMELDHLYQHASIGLCLLDTDLRYVRINQAMADYNGASVAEHIGRFPWEVIPDIEPAQEAFIRQLIETGEPLPNVEVRGTTPAHPGEERSWLASFYPMKDESGVVQGITSMVIEITDQRRAEKALRAAVDDLEDRVRRRTDELDSTNNRLLTELAERKRVQAALEGSQGRLRQLLESTHAVPWEADATTGKFTYVGPQIERLLGYPSRLWYEREDFWADTIHPDDRDGAVHTYRHSSHSLKQYEFEYRAIAASGDVTWIQDLVTVEEFDGGPKLLRGFMIDITERKRAEEDLRESETQARLQREELAHVTRVATLGELAASLAHEINQPLTAIVSNAQAALRFANRSSPDMIELRSVLADIVDDGKRAGEVIRRIRGLVSKGVPLREPVSVDGFLHEVLQLVHQDAIERHVSIRPEIAPDLPTIRGDAIQLQQVILNLVMNGLEAMVDTDVRSRLLVVQASRDTDENVHITVTDSGCGVPPENAERIFDPFFTTKAEGMGMGLSINRSIVDAHGGRMWATKAAHGGTSLHVSLPVGEPEAG